MALAAFVWTFVLNDASSTAQMNPTDCQYRAWSVWVTRWGLLFGLNGLATLGALFVSFMRPLSIRNTAIWGGKLAALAMCVVSIYFLCRYAPSA